jgi:hypothetical protein
MGLIRCGAWPCGVVVEEGEAEVKGWLVMRLPKGDIAARCPKHINVPIEQTKITRWDDVLPNTKWAGLIRYILFVSALLSPLLIYLMWRYAD